MEDYAALGFPLLQFTLEVWNLHDIPGREAFREPRFFDSFSDVAARASNPHDWLAHYMLDHGTWNTPIAILRNPNNRRPPSLRHLRSPHHLLEGHRRLSFLNGLRQLGKANETHRLWVATVRE
jgi:hypothetical protein